MISNTHKKGFTLVETLVGTAVFVVIAIAAYQAFTVLMNVVIITRAKVAGTELANERFEIIRNLSYNDVGILGGIPVGKITRTQTLTRDNFTFNVTTTIRNVDDAFDGTIGGNPNDTSPADYKLVDLDITCANCKNFAPVNFTTLIAPHALETASTNGALFIRVFDANGIPIPQALVHIVNTLTNPDTIIDETTDNNGWIKIIDAPAGTNAYNITATKNGYTTDQTYPIGGAAGSDPAKPDVTVVQQQISQISLAIDKISSLTTTTLDASCVAIPSVGFSLTGSKLIGVGILKYPTQNFTTNGAGVYNIPSIEYDTYSTLLTGASYDLAGTNLTQNFFLNPNETGILKLIAVPHVSQALLVNVETSAGVAIDGATVQLQKTGFDETKTTNSGTCPTPGQVFWNGISSGTYTVNVSAPGYQDNTVANYSISSPWQNLSITLMP
ncbi:MAG: prepilin-type N-terminal cleavage/methylation domain-containing protein [Candidatus Pacebacteria bacterium]|nr:prepilin-type N-terminal cleavage/methylation domain-containing protein [Candidatus Paceibacterota bacterium]